jgi:hypothetical protein
MQLRRIRELYQAARSNDSRDLRRQGEALFIRDFAVATALPTILIFRWIRGTKFIGQALTFIAMTGQTRKPVHLRAAVGLRRRSRQGRLREPVRSGSNVYSCRTGRTLIEE